MPASCSRRNPLLRSGTAQQDRILPALDPKYFRVDERTTADWVLFAQRYSRHLKFYNAANTVDGDWSPFFSNDISATLAWFHRLPVAALQQFSFTLRRHLIADPSRDEENLKNHLRLFFHLPLLLLREMGATFERLPRDHRLREVIPNLVARDVQEPLRAVIAFYKGAAGAITNFGDEPLGDDYKLDSSDTSDRPQLPTTVINLIRNSVAVADLDLSDALITPFHAAGWADLFVNTAADQAPYSGTTVYDKIYSALTYNLLTTALERIYQSGQRVAEAAGTEFERSLQQFDAHQPHYGLWLTFLRLLEHSRDHLNTLTERHLNYYYREVLRLQPRAPMADTVHLLLRLNKNIAAHLLPAGTLLKAGKDPAGRDVVFKLDADSVINRAQVAALKSVFRPTIKVGAVTLARPRAAEVTNSRDGLGTELPKFAPQWRPFGAENILPDARIGFAIADRRLFLREGRREIVAVIDPDKPLNGGGGGKGSQRRSRGGPGSGFAKGPSVAQQIKSLLPGLTGLQAAGNEATDRVEATHFPLMFKAFLTGEEGWLEISDAQRLKTGTLNGMLVFAILLDGETPAVVPYDPAIHGEGYAVSAPVMKIQFDIGSSPQQPELVARLRNLQFESIWLLTMANDLHNMMLQNESGAVDPAKPFLPFGPTPVNGSSLLVGSSELFSKEIEELTVQASWERRLNGTCFFRKEVDDAVDVDHLKAGSWQSLSSNHSGFFGGALTLLDLDVLSSSEDQTLENPPYTVQSRGGFLRVRLRDDFGHKAFIDEKTFALIALTGTGTWTADTTTYNYQSVGGANVPKDPYTPKITEVSLSYVTAASAPDVLLHLYPFGFKQISAGRGRLFPAFSHEGELYIGIQDLKPPQTLSLLIQTVDGSSNPLKGETTLQWSYLRNNSWTTFERRFVSDRTGNLTSSGIVTFAVPEDAGLDHTLLPSGLHWLQMSAAKDADALNSLLSIDAQAVSASFLDQGNDLGRLSTPLPAGTISKLKVAEAEVKEIRQPYTSFGAKPPESNRHFYVRASERLRHKNRAATMWDYEHLVLEQFPQIYKVKCINHTKLHRDLNNNILADNEVKPGHVLVVPISFLKGRAAANPLRPYTDKKTIVAIDQFLRTLISPFVQLEVQNPKIEEVRVAFRVAFMAGIGDTAFYIDQLNGALIRFMCPWAYDEGADISFQGRWHKSSLVDFVEEQPYVDYVKDFRMYHKPDIAVSDNYWQPIDQESIEATTARSILVAHAAHDIEHSG